MTAFGAAPESQVMTPEELVQQCDAALDSG